MFNLAIMAPPTPPKFGRYVRFAAKVSPSHFPKVDNEVARGLSSLDAIRDVVNNPLPGDTIDFRPH